MRVFLLDLWLDLKEKRLHWVAAALLAGIIAVPILLAKSSKQEVATPPPTTTNVAPTAPVIQSSAQAGPVASKLQTFSPRDPFEPTTAPTVATSGGGGTGTGTSAAGTGTSTTPGATPGAGNQAGGGTTGTGTTPSGPGTTGTGTTGTTTPQTKTTLFTYTVDLRFGAPGDEKLTKNVQRLELIPDAKNPKIVFLGVTTTGKTAVFLVDSSLGVDTNGKCRPSADQCSFLYLRPDGTHDTAELTDQNGNTFRLHLLKIHRVIVSSTSGSTKTGSSGGGKSGGSGRSPAFTGSVDSSQTATGDSAPPGEPSQPFSFNGFFADSSSGGDSGSGG